MMWLGEVVCEFFGAWCRERLVFICRVTSYKTGVTLSVTWSMHNSDVIFIYARLTTREPPSKSILRKIYCKIVRQTESHIRVSMTVMLIHKPVA